MDIVNQRVVTSSCDCRQDDGVVHTMEFDFGEKGCLNLCRGCLEDAALLITYAECDYETIMGDDYWDQDDEEWEPV